MFEECAASRCYHDGDVWVYSPRVNGLVPACMPHALDVTAGATVLEDNVPVREKGVLPA